MRSLEDADADRLEALRLRYAYTVAAGNTAGALVVFALLVFVVPAPPHVKLVGTQLWVNLAAFVAFGAAAMYAGWSRSARRYKATLAWAAEGRVPDEREREATLRFPLVQQQISASIWGSAAVAFAVLNAFFSLVFALDVGVGIVLGGLVTCALGFLLSERSLRPLTALALSWGPPGRPQLPGVGARALLSWTLGTGTVLVALALLGLGGLTEAGYTAQRLSIAALVLGITGLAVGLLTTTGLARSIAEPVAELRRGVAAVEAGDLVVRVVVDDGSEIGLLQAGFNQMVAGLEERERLRDLFGRQVGEDVARHALEVGVSLGGEARQAAVLFVDIVGSTSLAAHADPTRVVLLLNTFFDVVVDVVGSEDGWVNKFEGDAALAVFGAPLPDPEAATHALRAARALATRLREEVEPTGIRAGIGVSAGRVVAGNIGAARRFEYTVIGDPVNEAARLTELAKSRPGGVLASGAALDAADPAERARWELGEEIVLRGRPAATRLAAPRAGEPVISSAAADRDEGGRADGEAM